MLNKLTTLSLLLLSSVAFSQNVYKPIEYEGEIPSEFLKSAEEKTDDATNKKDDILTKQQRKKFYTSSYYTLNNVLLSGDVYYNDPLTKYVNEVADKLLESRLDDYKLKFYVTRYTSVNAVSWGEGSIFINIGLLSVLENEAQLAFILGHEIEHYLRKHSVLTFMRRDAINQFGGGLEAIFSALRFSRDNELDADKHGFDLMSESGYDCREAVSALRLLKNYGEDDCEVDFMKFLSVNGYVPDTPSFKNKKYFDKHIKPDEEESDIYSTHPSLDKRISKLLDFLKDYDHTYKKVELTKGIGFKELSRIAKMEQLVNLYNNHDYSKALFYGMCLSEKNTEDEFIYQTILQTLEGIARYSSYASEGSVIDKIGNTFSYSYYKLQVFLNKLSKTDSYELAYYYSKHLLDKYPLNPEVLIASANIAELVGKEEEATEHLSKYLSYYPDGKHAYYVKNKLKK